MKEKLNQYMSETENGDAFKIIADKLTDNQGELLKGLIREAFWQGVTCECERIINA